MRDCGRSSPRASVIAWAAVIGCYCVPALGGELEPTSDLSPQTQQSTVDRQNPDYNGEDFTRPQRSVETRFLYETSSGATSQTDRGTWLLRANWRSQLGAGWRLGLLGQVPVVDKLTFNPTSTDREFGVGDAAVQAALLHDIDQQWAFGIGARLVVPTAEDSLGSGKWQIMPGRDALFLPRIRTGHLFRTGYPLCDQLCRRSFAEKHQRAADRADFEHRFAERLVRQLLPKQRRPHQLRQPDFRPNRPALPSV